MGGTASSAQDNDKLIDDLMESGYIRTKKVEQVFRAVDRADYILFTHREHAYKDLAWRHGNIHLSAPCIYSEVMEGLSLEPGMSFLNLGSGTGYLSTMAGLILNQHGINHGIELHENCLRYAYKCLEKFKQKLLALDEFDFCEPLFIQGNCLSVAPSRQYDRVYCSAACPESHEAFIKQFVRIGGILVMPFKDYLLRVQRVDENTWSQKILFPVSFATLVMPTAADQNLCHLPECDPLSLQELCRGKIRHCLRENVWKEHADVETTKTMPAKRSKAYSLRRSLKRGVVPTFDESDEAGSDGDEEFTRRARLVLNFHAQPGEAITTTLKLVESDGDLALDQGEGGNEESNATGSFTNSKEGRRMESSRKSSNEKSGSSSQRQSGRYAAKGKSLAEDYSNMSESESDDEHEGALVERKNSASGDATPSEDLIVTHYVDNNAFTTYMMDKIRRLPLPFSLKLYINYNRKL
ncbi:hypothetical protein KM043_001732 [Ampulex compressa]|nr:hypothetical protein KM043_001732 [Ampulex compressa]